MGFNIHPTLSMTKTVHWDRLLGDFLTNQVDLSYVKVLFSG